MTQALPLAIVTSSSGYGRYFYEWAQGILAQTVRPAEVCIVTHGDPIDRGHAVLAGKLLEAAGLRVKRIHHEAQLDFGAARNAAVALAESEWVMHADVDDVLLPHCLEMVAPLMADAEIVALGFDARKLTVDGPLVRTRIYRDMKDGAALLASSAPCSGLSPFRRYLWEASPYRTDMLGAWDTALWIGFAHRFGAALRTRATPRAGFVYRQHDDSVFNRRRRAQDWSRAHTEAMLGTLRRNPAGVSVIVPLGQPDQRERLDAWARVRAFYEGRFPAWEIVEGRAPSAAWCKGRAVADALTRARGEILVIADADCLVDPGVLAGAVDRVQRGEAPWAVPHGLVHRLDQATSARLLTLPEDPGALALERPAYQGFAGGGILVVPRVGYLATGGFPRSFVGWGSEDQALALILDTCLGPHWRGDAPLYHLWHPPQDRRADRATNFSRLRTLRAIAPHGRDALVEYLRRGTVAETRQPSWKRNGIELAKLRREQAIAAGKFVHSSEPHWIQQAKAAKARRAAERKRELEGEGDAQV